MTKILVVTTEPVPITGSLTTGAGLRAWGLAQGLISADYDVVIGTPNENNPTSNSANIISTTLKITYFQRSQLPELITQENPDIVVLQHWGLAYALPQVLPCPLVIDLAGPHLLERQFWGNPDPDADRQEKINALSRADFITVGGYKQRAYFMPFLREAGFTQPENEIPVIPFSVSADKIAFPPTITSPITFVYGGAFLAWQNPEKPIRWLLEEMDARKDGRLLFYGGTHPNLDASGGRFADLYRYLSSHPRVELRGWKPFDQLCFEYANEGHVALDLMERNAERELAYTTRTMVYLACGLPVIYNNYSELSPLVNDSNAGWVMDPENENEYRQVIGSIFDNPTQLSEKRHHAQRFATNQSWDKTIAPLATFCASPYFRTSKPVSNLTPPHLIESPDNFEKIRFRRKLFHKPGKTLGILVYIPVLLVCKYLNYTLNVGKINSRAHKEE